MLHLSQADGVAFNCARHREGVGVAVGVGEFAVSVVQNPKDGIQKKKLPHQLYLRVFAFSPSVVVVVVVVVIVVSSESSVSCTSPERGTYLNVFPASAAAAVASAAVGPHVTQQPRRLRLSPENQRAMKKVTKKNTGTTRITPAIISLTNIQMRVITPVITTPIAA